MFIFYKEKEEMLPLFSSINSLVPLEYKGVPLLVHYSVFQCGIQIPHFYYILPDVSGGVRWQAQGASIKHCDVCVRNTTHKIYTKKLS